MSNYDSTQKLYGFDPRSDQAGSRSPEQAQIAAERKRTLDQLNGKLKTTYPRWDRDSLTTKQTWKMEHAGIRSTYEEYKEEEYKKQAYETFLTKMQNMPKRHIQKDTNQQH